MKQYKGNRTLLIIFLATGLLGCSHKMLAQAEIQPIDLDLFPGDGTVRYENAYLQSPGKIDLRQLSFTPLGRPSEVEGYGDDEYDEDYDEDDEDGDEDYEAQSSEGSGPFHRRQLSEKEQASSYFDVVIFHSNCAINRRSCDFLDFGVGHKINDHYSGRQWCCTQKLMDEKVCSEYGRLIIDHSVFHGDVLSLEIPPMTDPPVTKPQSLPASTAVANATETGSYTVVFANCNAKDGRLVMVGGQIRWESKGGLLAGELFGVKRYYTLFTFFCLALAMTYYLLHLRKQQNAQRLHYWILLTFVLVFGESLFRSLELSRRNRGHSPVSAVVMQVFVGSFKHAIFIGLAILAAQGWCSGQNLVAPSYRIVCVLGFIYFVVGVFAATDDMVNAAEGWDNFDEHQSMILSSVVGISILLVLILDLILFIWAIVATNRSLWRLRNLNAEEGANMQEVGRFTSLRKFYILVVLFFVVIHVIEIWALVRTEQMEKAEWRNSAVNDAFFLAILMIFAGLLRPQHNNEGLHELAPVVELPSHDLALSADAVQPEGYTDDQDEKLPVEDAEAT